MKMYGRICFAIAVAACAGTASAELISIDPATGVTVSGVTSGRTGDRIVNGSGLDASGLHSNSPNDLWQSSGGNVWVVFDFGAIYSVTNIHIWNYNGDGTGADRTARSVSSLVVRYGNLTFGLESSGFESTLEEISTLARAPNLNTYAGEAFDDFEPFNTRYVLFDILDDYGDAGSGLSEVQFYGTFVEDGPTVPTEITGVTVESVSSEQSYGLAVRTLNNDGLNILGYHVISSLIGKCLSK